MQHDAKELLRDIGFAVIRFREVYRRWCREQGISYHEMLIFYTLRDMGECTQKDICDFYALPKQTVHNIVHALRERGMLTLSRGDVNRRERILQLTEKGKIHSEKFMEPLLKKELEAVSETGVCRLRQTVQLLTLYTEKLDAAMNFPGEGEE